MAAVAIAVAGSRYGDTRVGPARRAVTLALVVAAHVSVIALLLADREAMRAATRDSELAIFDVAPPAPPPEPEPLVPRTQSPARQRSSSPGGSTGRIARRPAPEAVGAAAVADITLTPAAPPAPPSRIGIGTAEDLAGPGTAGTTGLSAGLGSGQGNGVGDGIGDGSGSDGGVAWRRAEWIQKPDDATMAPFWPRYARRMAISGTVRLACIVPRPGPVRRCWTIDERPRGIGFGQAALAMSRHFRIRPVATDARDRDDIPVIVPVVFEAKRTATSAVAAPPAPPQP